MTIPRSVLLSLLLSFALYATAQEDSVLSRIITIGTSDNRVMEHMDFLSNRFGDRLTGSDNYYSACVWMVNTMRSWGMMAGVPAFGFSTILEVTLIKINSSVR